MERNGRPRRRPDAPSAPPTTITELARRYHSCAVALAKSLGLPMTEAFLRDHRESVSSIFIASDRAGVRLPPAVQLPPLSGPPAADPPAEAGEIMCSGMPPAPETPTTGQTEVPVTPTIVGVEADVPDFPPPPTSDTVSDVASTNGDTPALSVITTVAELPTRIPAGLQLPCAEALIVDLRPPQLSLLIGKVGLKALADKSLEPLHVALLAERARRFEQGRKAPKGEGDADGA